MQYRLNDRCTNNQAEQMAILKVLEYIQNMESDEKIVLVHTDNKINFNYYKTRKNIQTSYSKLELKYKKWNNASGEWNSDG